jgi:hypothetical protein
MPSRHCGVLPASSLDLLQGTLQKIHFQRLLRKGSLQSLVLLLQAFNRSLRHSPQRLIERQFGEVGAIATCVARQQAVSAIDA